MNKHKFSLIIIILIIWGLNSACTVLGPVFQSDPTTKSNTLVSLMPSFPTRTFKVEGGSIALQAIAMQNPGARPNSSFPSIYMIKIRNETKIPLWFTVVWTFPTNNVAKKKSKQIGPWESYALHRKTTGIVADKKILYSVSVFTDEARTHKIGEENSFMYFNLHEVEVYRKSFSSKGIATINGLQEIK